MSVRHDFTAFPNGQLANSNSAGRLACLSVLPVLTYIKVRSAPVLERHAIRLSRANFQAALKMVRIAHFNSAGWWVSHSSYAGGATASARVLGFVQEGVGIFVRSA